MLPSSLSMSSPLFLSHLHQHYSEVKRQYPSEGRRRWRLRLLQSFWQQVSADAYPMMPATPANEDFVSDDDPLDDLSIGQPELGLIVRTDFSDDDAWSSFCSRLEDGEKEFTTGMQAADNDEQPVASSPVEDSTVENEDSDDEEIPSRIFYVIDPQNPDERASLTNISNLTALRLLNDVDVRPSPGLPEGVKRIRSPSRLVDVNGLQEFYFGKQIWIYDTKSNRDECVRLVSQSGDMYGTATGDSWRARVSHICELQVNLFAGTIKIDFGGLDRWDYAERARNIAEAEQTGLVFRAV